jgi:nitroimidazol reductase NimA-like FMN-containing flavoprotein (pyridoxamine 5'-phosphate oxidase superfamily)
MTRLRLTDEEAWDLLEHSRVGIFTSLRRDGTPISLPVWFAPLDRRIYLQGPATTKKFDRVRRDPRVSFVCEHGERWAELRAVHVSGNARVVEDNPEIDARVTEAFDRRYAELRPPRKALTTTTRDHYRTFATIEIVPGPRVLSWDNSRLQMATS